jgi:hypothetical protein
MLDLTAGVKKTMKITKDMKLAMASYYLNRTKPGWNKKADLEAIQLACVSRFKFTAIAGFFRFECPIKRAGHIGTCVIECDINNFLAGGQKMVYAPSIFGED